MPPVGAENPGLPLLPVPVGTALVAADAAFAAPNDFIIIAPCAIVIAERAQPPAMPDAIAAPSAAGSSL